MSYFERAALLRTWKKFDIARDEKKEQSSSKLVSAFPYRLLLSTTSINRGYRSTNDMYIFRTFYLLSPHP
jgi:hypothetical protein